MDSAEKASIYALLQFVGLPIPCTAADLIKSIMVFSQP